MEKWEITILYVIVLAIINTPTFKANLSIGAIR